MTDRKRLSAETLTHEKLWVSQYALTKIARAPGAKLSISDIFEDYCAWVKKQKLGESQLSVDGFGRLFPKHYSRGPASYHGEPMKCVFNIRIVS